LISTGSIDLYQNIDEPVESVEFKYLVGKELELVQQKHPLLSQLNQLTEPVGFQLVRDSWLNQLVEPVPTYYSVTVYGDEQGN
jgi:hypothetical protein